MVAALRAPLDVRLMNQTAVVLVAGCVFLVMAAAFWWAIQHPIFSFSRIVVQGDLLHNNAVSLRANVAPHLTGNFFTLNLGNARKAFEQAPWVRRAQVHRVFPGTLHVVLEEHVPVAYWDSEDAGTVVNKQGEIFEADATDLASEGLPMLSGPSGQSAQVLAMYRAMVSALEPLGATLKKLAWSKRGDWHVTLDSGAHIALGEGNVAQVRERVRQFVATLPKVAAQHGRRVDALESADLRHRDGYALRLRGVSTVSAEQMNKR